MKMTPNYNLKKPTYEEFGDVELLNENADKIDAALKVLSDALGGIDLTNLSKAIANVDNKVTTHLEDEARHVTQAKQNNWNAASVAVNGGRLGETCKNLTNGDWNTATSNGWYMGSNMWNSPSGAPSANWYMGEVIVHNEQYMIQRVRPFSDRPKETYERFLLNGVWGPWEDVTFIKKLPTPTLAVLQAGWRQDAAAPLKYYKDNAGVVRISGRVFRNDGNSSRTAFILPVGYRPLSQVESVIGTGTGMVSYMSIHPDGNTVMWGEGASNFNMLVNTSFRTDA